MHFHRIAVLLCVNRLKILNKPVNVLDDLLFAQVMKLHTKVMWDDLNIAL